MADVDPYAVLGLAPGVLTDAEIKKAYRKKALVLHPDKRKDSEREVAQREFDALQKAYDILLDPQARKALEDLAKARAATQARFDAQDAKRRKLREDLERRERAAERGKTEEEDAALEVDLLADEKEKAEHVMLVDLGRNDVGRVSKAGTVKVEKLMEIERYSHVMHISSTVTGHLLDDLGPWDVLRAALPVGTVSGAPKVRAMQIIDELEATRRGPYGGGIGYVGFTGEMDMALALRTMVVPTAHTDNMYKFSKEASEPPRSKREWVIHLQSGAGIVADSDPESEYQETVNKAAALGRAIDLAEEAFDV